VVDDGSVSTGGSATDGSVDGSVDGTADDFAADGQPPIPTPNPTEECDTVLPVIFRDFTEAHPDFEMAFSGDTVRVFLVENDLGTDFLPVFNPEVDPLSGHRGDGIGCDPTQIQSCQYFPKEPVITSATSFADWYHTDPAGTVNKEIPGAITLKDAGGGLFVFDSNDTGGFFPLGVNEGLGESPAGRGKNFLFTTEIHLNFGYVAGQTFDFSGDDDLWIFVNGHLAMDLGGMHNPADGTIDFDAQAAALGIRPGATYRMDIFHAERHTSNSNFKFTTNISCFTPAPIVK
jgi:fibro-slime domain-containing protein